MPVHHFTGSAPVRSPDFDEWVRLHEHDGYFINVAPSGVATLHRASCALVGIAGRARGAGVTANACSCDRSELMEWARAERLELTPCDCV